jgi:PST family polysaccharide transporter
MLAWAAVKGASWLVVSRIVGRSIDVLSLLILARLLQPAEFGLVALAMALVVVVDTVLEIPTTQALIRLGTVDRGHLDTAFTLGVLRSIAVTALLLAAMFPYSWIRGDASLVPAIAVLALGPALKGFASPATIHFIRDVNFRPTFLIEMASKLCAFGVTVAIVNSGGSYWAIVASYVTNALVATLASHLLAPYRPRLSLECWSDFASFIGWYSFAQLISAFNWQYDRFLVGAFGSHAMLGRYAVANDVAVIPTQSIIGPALQPVMAAFSRINTDDVRMKFALLRATRFAMLISVPACLGIALTADLVTDIVLGPQWKDASIYLRLLAISVIPAPYFQVLYAALLSIGRPKEIFRNNLLDLAIRVLFISSAFFFFSALGACVARIFISFAMFGLYLVQARRVFTVGIGTQLKNLWKIVISAGVMTVAVLLLGAELDGLQVNVFLRLAAVAVVGAVAYCFSLFALGVRIDIGPGKLDLVDRH